MRHVLIVITAVLSLTTQAIAQTGTTRQVENYIVVLDGSGSMGRIITSDPTKTKWDVAIEALLEVTGQLPENTNLGLLVFGANARGDGWVYDFSKLDHAKLADAVSRLSPDGGTPLGTYLKRGADRLMEIRQEQHNDGKSYTLLVLTDGEADRGNEHQLVKKYTPEIVERGIICNVIGLDMDEDASLKTAATNYRLARNAGDLSKAISASLTAEISSGSPEDAQFYFDTISPLSDEAATAFIQRLSNPPNHPIGTETPKLASSPATDPTAQQRDRIAQQQQQSQNSSPSFNPVIFIAIGLVAVVVFIIFITSIINR